MREVQRECLFFLLNLKEIEAMSYQKRSVPISPANDDWDPEEAWKWRKPTKSTRKEYQKSASEPDTSDDGYWDSLLRNCGFKHE